jgi:hypothetical protein
VFFSVFGDFRSEFASFLGILGLGIALNDGICRPAGPTISVQNSQDSDFNQTRDTIPAMAG